MSLPAKAVASRLLVTVMALAGMALAVRFIVDDRFSRDIQCLDQGPSLLYRAETLAKISMQCVSDARLDQASNYAYAALRRQPHNQLALAALGSVADLKNDPVRADFWFGRAKELGHRDYAVETYWISRRAAQKQWDKVAQHIDALFRAGWKSDEAEAQLRQLESTAEGRNAILAIVHPSSPWIISYLKNTSLLTDQELAGRRQLLLDISKRGLEDAEFFNLSVATPAIKTSYDRRNYEAAYTLRQAFMPFVTRAVVNDPNFNNFSKKVTSPFDWTSRNSAGIDLSHDQSSSEPSPLRLNVNDPGRYLILEQTLQLEPGMYTVRLKGDSASQAESKFVVEIWSIVNSKKIVSLPLPLPTPRSEANGTARFRISSFERFFRVSLMLDADSPIGGSNLELHSFAIEKIQ